VAEGESAAARARARLAAEVARNGVRDPRALAAIAAVPRERFVDAADVERAYEDRPLSIGAGQTISQPTMVARTTELAQLGPGARVLEIGTGSGYQAAVMAATGARVLSVERIPSLAARARAALDAAGFEGVEVRVGDGTLGAPDAAPFDAIVVTAGAPAVPPALVAQLAPGGRLVIPVGDRALQHLRVVVRQADGSLREERHDACVYVPLIGAEGWRD
jgi:protein-L-isoaspartate(D-aspartate) O-methyltransferase